MKSENGITVTILTLTVVILAIIIGIVSYNSVASIKMKRYYNMCSDIELLDEKISLYYLKNKELPIIDTDTKDVNDIIEDAAENNDNPNNSGVLYKIDLSKLDNLSLNYTDYYINEESHTIYISKGIDIDDGQIYYTVPLKYQQVDLSLYR